MTSTETPTEIAAYRALVRAQAESYMNSGYATREAWNATMVHLGLEPFPTKQIKITKRLEAVVTKTFDAPAGDPQDWVDRNRSGLITIYDLQNHLPAVEDGDIEVVDGTPGVEGEEPLPGAGTADLKVFKRLVRREALRLREEFEWCEGGTNTALTELGLPGVDSLRVPVDLTVTRRVFINTDAADQEEAIELMRAGELEAIVKNQVSHRDRLVAFELSDPNVHFPGDPDPTDWGSSSNSLRRAEAAGRCAAPYPDTGYGCTWQDHDHEADHVAASYGEILVVWPKA